MKGKRPKSSSNAAATASSSNATNQLIIIFAAILLVFISTVFLLALSIEDTDSPAGRFLNQQQSAFSELANTVPKLRSVIKKKKKKGSSSQGNETTLGAPEVGKVQGQVQAQPVASGPPHLYPQIPYLPPFSLAPNSPKLISDLLFENKPTIAGIHALLNNFMEKMHIQNLKWHDSANADGDKLSKRVVERIFALTTEHLMPLDRAYRNKPIFPVREDGSIFLSLASYRDHMLGRTLKQAFSKAANPDNIFVAAIVQNCFGVDVQCRTGVEVVGKRPNGNPLTKVSDAPPDKNGIEEFCTDEAFKKYCDAGQIRALYVNETESLGPAVARYYASKLWGGETYFVQTDAHLQFAPSWDEHYVTDLKSAKNYPKAVLSTYPPGFSEGDPDFKGGSRGTRLCTCEFSVSDVEHHIIRINTGMSCQNDNVKGPTQIAFIAAGFFFAHASFLTDVPFDPYLPWCFMGEEIALSIRAWTQGWNIYAPKQNWIRHQYRPGRMGLPKFWENVGRVFNRPGPGFNTKLQTRTIKRIKNMVGYEGEVSRAKIEEEGDGVVLTDIEHYGVGTVRPREDYIKLTEIDFENRRCRSMKWCNRCELE